MRSSNRLERHSNQITKIQKKQQFTSLRNSLSPLFGSSSDSNNWSSFNEISSSAIVILRTFEFERFTAIETHKMPTLKRYLNVSEQFFRLYSLNKWLYLCRMEHKLLNFLGIYQSDSMENHAVELHTKNRSGRSEASTRNDTFCGIRLRHRPFALARTDSTHLLVLYVHRMCVFVGVCAFRQF